MKSRLTAVRPAAALGILALIVAYAIVWPTVAPQSWLDTNFELARNAPSWPHLFGTDTVGSDLTVTVARALRTSLAIAVASAAIATAAGTLIGATAATLGGRGDMLIMRLTDAIAGLPAILATLIVVAMFRGSEAAIIAALAATHWTGVARVVRGEVLAVISSDYVAASRAAGASTSQIVRHHVLSAASPQAGVAIAMLIPHAIWHESTLSFLGVGMPPEKPSLGTVISTAAPGLLAGQWWQLLFPTAALIAVTLAAAALAPAARRAGALAPMGDVPYKQNTNLSGESAAIVDKLTVTVPGSAGPRNILDRAHLELAPGTITALLGPSGAGKTTLAHAICGLAPAGADITGTVTVAETVGYLPQHAAQSFTPTRAVRSQLAEICRRHRTATPNQLAARVGLNPTLLDHYPHELSGGQAQRTALAAALAVGGRIIVADEPTSGLDPAATRHVLELLRDCAERGAAVLLITHNTAALRENRIADRELELAEGVLRDAHAARPQGARRESETVQV